MQTTVHIETLLALRPASSLNDAVRVSLVVVVLFGLVRAVSAEPTNDELRFEALLQCRLVSLKRQRISSPLDDGVRMSV